MIDQQSPIDSLSILDEATSYDSIQTRNESFIMKGNKIPFPQISLDSYQKQESSLNNINSSSKNRQNVNNNAAESLKYLQYDPRHKTVNNTFESNKRFLFSKFFKKENKKIRKKRVPFTLDEDEKLKNLVNRFGVGNWSLISKFMTERTPKQCRDRYCNYLAPGYFKGEWTKEEDELLVRLYYLYGPKWASLKQHFTGRSPNSLKNRWNYFLSYQQNNTSRCSQFQAMETKCIDSCSKELIEIKNVNNSFNQGNDEKRFGNLSNEAKNEGTFQLIDNENEIFDIIQSSFFENESDWFIIN